MPADAELYLLTKEISDGGEANFKKKHTTMNSCL